MVGEAAGMEEEAERPISGSLIGPHSRLVSLLFTTTTKKKERRRSSSSSTTVTRAAAACEHTRTNESELMQDEMFLEPAAMAPNEHDGGRM